ncbi:putative polyketide synthase [Aspergillus mulundensis]|uniref:Polyketide synthase, putative (JCVI) n=1 Tax=Aspergillus mulundensis TaxID=1810919 RepID=A0A3D8SKY8_9EURO|nr:Polyketide synthase, putative (JCVI) [Aspergillus mulundensis]RDW86990.1 Polyketide synthase, putative (JCVI) [Aspergillus mulundensis]
MQGSSHTLLAFGPQSLSFDKRALNKLRQDISRSSHRRWIQETIAELPALWTILSNALPELSEVLPPQDRLQDLSRLLEHGDSDVGDELNISNIILTPLVVLTHLTEYEHYLATEHQPIDKATATGFCTGLLSTFAVASSRTAEDLATCGPVAVRLAMLVGALVDAEEARQELLGNGRSVSYSIAWTSDDQERRLQDILKQWHPEVYLSVQYDRARATLTSSGRAAAALAQELRKNGLTVAQVRLQGRFHDPSDSRKAYTDALVDLCDRTPALQYASTPSMSLAYANPGNLSLHEIAVRSMLVQRCDWYDTFSAAYPETSDPPRVVCFGSEKCIPPSLARRMKSGHQQEPNAFAGLDQDNMIAVVGMSIKTAGADDLDEFAQMLRTGKSQHQAIKEDEINFNTPWRTDKGTRTWYSNLIKDRSQFDHSFFKMSPREAAAMDPQHRHFLQAAYQAVEQSGYFTEPGHDETKLPEDSVGVFVGIATTDYDQHVACHDPNAYTATGNLRAFLAGRVSHQFGWTGPALTLDTACSSSAVAIHLACRSILAGECSSALAGGVAVMSSPFWFQNLAAASFLSPTGQCKPFDEKGDGYCRSEGIGCVMLKRMSAAVANNDQILGCIAATAVHQNQNCTALVVPNKPSLAPLFKQVVSKSGLTSADISLVEAHGTGTAVGDPAEYASIAQALDVAQRPSPLFLGSVKGHVGHTEAAAGVVSLVKVLTMMNEGFIPPQASHTRLSPRITAATDKIRISSELRAWDSPQKAALVNSYGASGSNTSMVVVQPRKHHIPRAQHGATSDGLALPFWISGTNDAEVTAYCARLAEYIRTRPSTQLDDLSFNLSRQCTRTLARQFVFSCRSVSELQTMISQGASADGSSKVVPAERPVILCFGGQVSTFVGLNRPVYDSVSLLRRYLDECDAAMTSMGLESIYPEIFASSPVQDTVKLQCMLFAMQYSCARCWLDCGVSTKIAAVVGHSFGELTALSISGVLSVQDTIKLVAGRARLIRDQWGSDRGAMMAVEGDESIIHQLLEDASQQTKSSHPASIACYNGPRSFTLGGSTAAIQGVKETLVSKYPYIRHKQLNVTNAFHCSLVDGIVEPLKRLGEELTFNSPAIHIEHSSSTPSTGARPSATFVADHLRKPVYFYHAIERLARAYPDSIWLEAGSNSTITTMAGRALRPTSDIVGQSQHHFQALNITHGGRGSDSLTETTLSLWKEGLRVSFWQHHAVQMNQYAHLILPPRQFAKTRHGQDIIAPKTDQGAMQQAEAPKPDGLWTFVGYEDNDERRPRFQINSESEKYLAMVEGHVMARTAAICPAGLEVDMAIEALFSLHPEWKTERLQPMLTDMVNSAPVCLDPYRKFWLQLSASDEARRLWDWNITSTRESSTSSLLHVKGSLHIRSPEDAIYRADFSRLERLVPHRQCTDLLAMAGATPVGMEDEIHVLQGRNVYQGFSDVISYTPLYRSLRRLVGHGNESAGCVMRKRSHDTWLDVPLSECFMQTGGIWVSCMTDRSPDDVFIATGCELWMRSPSVADAKEKGDEGPDMWHVLARHSRVSDKVYLTDVFVFDSRTGALTEVIMGTKFSRIPKTVMRKILSEFQPDTTVREKGPTRQAPSPLSSTKQQITMAEPPRKRKSVQKPDITDQVCQLLSSVCGIEPAKISRSAELSDLGVDSLMAMELAREVEGVFKFSPDHNDLLEATTVEKLTSYISSSLSGFSTSDDNQGSSHETDSSGESNPATPTVAYSSTDDFREPFIIPSSRDETEILSLAESDDTFVRPQKPNIELPSRSTDREEIAEQYVARYTAGFIPPVSSRLASQGHKGIVVIITGATGSLGSHLVASFARNPAVRTVVCLNRRSNTPGSIRQGEALSSRRLELTEAESRKLRMLDGNTSEPHLGLPADEYTWLARNATHIVHNAWPMSLARPIHTFVPQFQALRNLLDLAREMACNLSPNGMRVGFQFVSSISVVGSAAQQRVLEQRVDLRSSLPIGYPEAKWVCERMLDETLHRYPDHFRPMVVRPGQITGSRHAGIWPHSEHMPLLIKTAQTLQAWPDLNGPLHWVPVDTVAQTMGDLLLPGVDSSSLDKREHDAYPVYHIDNPVGQPWKEMTPVITSALNIPSDRVIPYQDFLNLLRSSPLDRDREIPAAKIMDFFTRDFEHMACGGLILDTTLSQQHSAAMAAQGPVTAEEVRQYIKRWREMGFLANRP